MSEQKNEWIVMTPALEPESEVLEIVLACTVELSSVEWRGQNASDEIQKIREHYLRRLDRKDETRQAGRVCISVLSDLRMQGWEYRQNENCLLVRKPLANDESPQAEKARIRAGLLLEREQQLHKSATRRFVSDMERRRLSPTGEWVSVFSLMRDGQELADLLRQAALRPGGEERERALRSIIDPYIQVVDNSYCQETGLALKDIWRYFRHTWVNPHKTVPGRNVWFLIRDRAAAYHPIIGIAALGSAIIQLRVRDDWIGWNVDRFLQQVKETPNERWALWVKQSLQEQLDGIYLTDLLEEGIVTEAQLEEPTDNLLKQLRVFSHQEREKHRRYPKVTTHKSSNMDWAERTSTALFRSKRASMLADLLEAKLLLVKSGFESSGDGLAKVLQSKIGRLAVKSILRRVKAAHVGINMMDLIVCGAVQPYNSILGGKLVSLLMTSPEVVFAYQARYKYASSVIASSIAGKSVNRTPHLVFLGTTSLYGIGASQYHRLRIPAEEVGGENGQEVRYHKLGKTEGFGSFHFSEQTLEEFHVLAAQSKEGRRVNSIFGEGVNPRLRKVRDALDQVGLRAEDILQHGNSRIVYGIPLASNFREVLLGLEEKPCSILPNKEPVVTTRAIGDFWVRRWLSKRIEKGYILEDVASHTLSYPIDHGARVQLPDIDQELSLLTE